MIDKIKNKENIPYEQLSDYFNGYLNGDISDSDMALVLDEIVKYSLTKENIIKLTDIFIKSGDMLPLNSNFIDKHSTGGIGDKTTLIVLPILASLGVKVSKMSGRGLGHTGGTIDKLESIGVKVDLTEDEFFDSIEKHNMVISSQTSNLCPMDKKVYALRNRTGSTSSVALIAISIMSKKIASGAKKILIDVKVGDGALINTLEDAREFAKLVKEIGKIYDREVVCMLTHMDKPLGTNIGNRIEVMEVIDILQNKKRNNLYNLCIKMSSLMLNMAKGISEKEAVKLVEEVIENGKAYNKFKEYVYDMGGNFDINLPIGREYKANKDGYVTKIKSKKIGNLSMHLGAGRKKKEESIDPDAGIILNKTVGDKVNIGDTLFTMYGKDNIEVDSDIYEIGDNPKKDEDIILDII